MQKLSTAPFPKSKKAEGKKRKPPFTPYREKGKGKEISPCANRTGLSRGRAGARGVVAAAVAEAVGAFGGNREDELIWAKIAWRVGAANFIDAMFQTRAEIKLHASGVPRTHLPRIFQSVLNKRFPKGGAR